MTPVLLAIVFPVQIGPDWTRTAFSVFVAAIIPVIIVGVTIPDSFAGERERHTLETLLASRLPDRAVLLGKFLPSVALAWGVTLFFLLSSLVPLNVAHWDGEILFFTPMIAVADATLSFLFATLAAGTGVIVSQRSATIQEAAQKLMAIFLVPVMIVQAVMAVFLRKILDFAENLDGVQVLLIVVAVLVTLNLGVLTAAFTRFKRSRLILS
jgi:ABC-2 type transport system permease protein